ncbi:chitobiosyldiphosphodolichol beta-mannosyltransferase [Synchytrium microbalum]|uniref:Chitobiosyldiphosphodolichol beta-mannosyltransferase n=1 Tax=Synchytrium microbalum TaxID=1806994 RepID=A0A507C901_9FUNG|nr:chitobiosyldiphosphodolichol beta-mannosyltransferase [Synchytrium microbalum]TPX35639.1 chitobiosyldiphosphodolichol beta-mannosyltransferase [Synchytrium microbalum]
MPRTQHFTEERIQDHDEVCVADLPANIHIPPAVRLQLYQAEKDNLLGLVHLYSATESTKDSFLASQLFARAAFLIPNEPSYLLHRALALLRLGDVLLALPVAIAARELAKQQFPNHGGVFLGRILAQIYLCHAGKRLKANKFREVLDAIEKASQVSPLSFDALWMRAQSYIALDVRAPCIETLSLLIAMRPSNPELYAQRATMHKAMNNPVSAFHDICSLISLFPQHPDIRDLQIYMSESIVALKNRASACEIQDDLPGAIAALSLILEMDGGDRMSLLKRGILYARTGLGNQAVNDLGRFLSDPTRDSTRDAEAKLELSKICVFRAQQSLQTHDKGTAMQFCNKAVEFDSHYPDALRLRAELFHGRKELERAIQDMRAAHILSNKTDKTINERLATFYSESGDYKLAHGDFSNALVEYTLAIDIDQKHVHAFWGRAKASLGLQDPEAARRDVQQVLMLEPRHPAAVAASNALNERTTLTRPFPTRKLNKLQPAREYQFQLSQNNMIIELTLLALLILILYLLSRRTPRTNNAIVLLVLGDLGHSPRMQHHALTFANLGYHVYFIGYAGSLPSQEIIHHDEIECVYIPAPVRMQDGMSFIMYVLVGVKRVLVQAWDVWSVLMREPVGSAGIVLVQNPPALPTLGIITLISWYTACKFIIDWHNFGFTIMAMRLRKGHVYEMLFARFAHGHLTVTRAMKNVLVKDWRVSSPIHIYYDRPLPTFHPLTTSQKTTFKTTHLIPLTSPLLISSTSWTEDEDFSLLYNALALYEASPDPLPHITVIITGKGPLRASFESKIAIQEWEKVEFRFEWLTREEYPLLVGCADVGVCLHTSSSGLDLPMKVVDMFGMGVPVCAVGYECLDELVKHDVNGFVFTSSEELFERIKELLSGWPNKTRTLSRLTNGVSMTRTETWGQETDSQQELHAFIKTVSS